MYYDVCAILNWANQIRSGKCVIDHQGNFIFMSNLCDGFNVYNIGVWISQCLDKYGFCIFLNSATDLIEIFRINERCCNSVFRKGMGQKVVSSSVNVLCCYDVIAVVRQILNRIRNRCCSGSYCQCSHAAFQCCNTLFKYILCRVCQTSIYISCITQTKSCCCMFAVTEYVR